MKNKEEYKSDSPIIMYIIAIMMFFILSFTLLVFLHDIFSPAPEENDSINDKINVSEKYNKSENNDIFDVMINKIEDKNDKYSRYRSSYEAYEKQIKERQKLAYQQQQRLKILNQRKKAEQMAKVQNNIKKLQQMNTQEQHHATIRPELVEQPAIENVLLHKIMQKSPCDKASATAIVYFFHPNNSAPVELIFNNDGYDNKGFVKFVFGDLPRVKQHISKNNFNDLSSLINKPKYSVQNANKTTRDDILMKISAGVTTTCTPYVYKSADFFLTRIPVSLQPFNTRESYCKSKNARLADSLELTSIVMTGRLPAGYYWTTSKSYKLNPKVTSVSRNALTQTNDYLLLDFENSSISFTPQSELGKNIQAYSVCVADI